MRKFLAEVNYTDCGASFAAAYGPVESVQRSEVMTIRCDHIGQVEDKIRDLFKTDGYYYATLRNIGIIYEVT